MILTNETGQLVLAGVVVMVLGQVVALVVSAFKTIRSNYHQ